MREEGPPRTLLHAERRSLHPLAHANHKHADFLMSRTGRLIHQPFICLGRARGVFWHQRRSRRRGG